MELQGDTLALRKYTQEQYGGLTEEEITKKVLQNSYIDYDSKDFQEAKKQTDKMLGFQDDSLYKKIILHIPHISYLLFYYFFFYHFIYHQLLPSSVPSI